MSGLVQAPTARRDTTPAAAVAAGEADAEPSRRTFLGRRSRDLGFTTLDLGAAFLIDFATYTQDHVSREQVDVEPGFKVRDARFQLGGR